MKIIRMANLGLMDELLSEPSIWYCQSCNRCSQICPMTVKPAAVIAYVREVMLQKNLVSLETFHQFRDLLRRFQRVRWHAVLSCLKKEKLSISRPQFDELLNRPITPENEPILLDLSSQFSPSLIKALKEADTPACFTCAGCSSSCPVFYERGLFEPQTIFRMANLGLTGKLFKSPAIWLCIGCRKCTDSCGQLVKGHAIIEMLRTLSVKEGIIPISFQAQLKEMEKIIYPYLLEEIDEMFGFVHDNQGQAVN